MDENKSLDVYEERFKNHEKQVDSLKLQVDQVVSRVDKMDNNMTRLETTFDIYMKFQKDQMDEVKKDQKDNYDKLDKKMDSVIELITIQKNTQKENVDSFKTFGFEFFKDILKNAIYIAILLGALNGLKII